MSSDLVYCSGENCSLRENCRRFPLPQLGRFKSFGRSPYDPDHHSCEYFWSFPQPSQTDLETCAYYIWLGEGCLDGKALDHWLRACEKLAPRT